MPSRSVLDDSQQGYESHKSTCALPASIVELSKSAAASPCYESAGGSPICESAGGSPGCEWYETYLQTDPQSDPQSLSTDITDSPGHESRESTNSQQALKRVCFDLSSNSEYEHEPFWHNEHGPRA